MNNNISDPAASSPLEIGAGMYDITGPAAEAGMFGYAQPGQVTNGIHMRLRSRAFAFRYAPSNSIFVFVSVDVGILPDPVKTAVLGTLSSSNVVPKDTLKEANLMMSAVHTHCSPGGLSDHMLYCSHLPQKGHDRKNFECIVGGIVRSIERAYRNLRPGFIRVKKGLCLGASVNRSKKAYENNPPEERARYSHDTDKDMVLWRLDGVDGYPIGVINWFAVHPTSMGSWFTLITGDNKGYASYLFEKELKTNHLMDKPRSFVAAFAQTNSGDVSPNIYGPRHTVDEKKDFSRLVKVGDAQLNTALRLYEEALQSEPITGPIHYAHEHLDYSNIELKPRFNLHEDCPDRTSKGAIGFSTIAGTTFDGPGVPGFYEGMKWGNYPKISFCPKLQKEHMEKPILFPTGIYGLTPHVLPLQVVSIGSVALAAVPFEVTTMAGRRIRESLVDTLSAIGVSEVTLSCLANAYSGYLTTREEYSVQHYEGASTHFGPNQLNATIQELHHLAQTILETKTDPSRHASCLHFDRDGVTNTIGPEIPLDVVIPARKRRFHMITPVVHDGVFVRSFGDVVKGKDVKNNYQVGDTVKCVFHAGHPRNDFRTQGSFLEIQIRKDGFGKDSNETHWLLHADDSDVNTFFRWKRWALDASRATVEWIIPVGTPAGTYRIKHLGNYRKAWKSGVHEYVGFSSEFEVLEK